MMPEAIQLTRSSNGISDKVKQLIPDGNLSACLTCGTCTSGCPATGLMDMDPRKFLRMAVFGLDRELERHPWVWACTMCNRCYDACPMKLNIPQLIFYLRSQWPREERPKGILGSCDHHVRSRGGAMGVPLEDFQFTVEDVAEECREQEGFEELTVDLDREGAYFALNQNSREPVTEPDELMPLWKILHKVGADWTYYSDMWGGENYCMFLADDASWEKIVRAQAEHIDKLGCKVFLNTECGHSFYAVWAGLQRFNIPHKFEFRSIVEYYARWIREGKLPVTSGWNTTGIKFTVQDPCNVVRKSLGDRFADDLRYVVKQVVGEENFVEMAPNKSNNFCCGGGGGALQAGYTDERRQYGKTKFDQIQATGANYVVTPCHNCHAQIEDMAHAHGGDYYTVHLWTLICLSMGILGENERTYLGPDLAEYGL
ncbi:oxidoreductase, selenocysteine-containing [Desulfotignum phosphitoxidans DSM 13687]|uniref:Oxidoreductase, selenocysteine-containing n=2 Tax=Desulfotignum phosphitoxidans TaxID=190898 RepID=S0G621_9BACT|nr:oxidoreductase, selenocysteine-containing [Desulfotignum phosphitoxidans DSM 13687]